jgi:OOP family OmpA-OmpF porin
MDLIVVPLLSALVYLITQHAATTDRVLLLPDANGKAGAVVIQSSHGEQTLNTAYATARVTPLGTVLQTGTDTAEAAHGRYAAVLKALPPKPVSYTVYFQTGSDTELTPESLPVLAQMKAALLERPAPEVTVIGHTDTVGSPAVNDALSLARASTVRDLLTASGLQATSLDIAGRGKRELLVPTADEVAEEKNRRVEINVR